MKHAPGQILRYLSLLLPCMIRAADVKVEIRNSEVWLLRDGQERQLTSDGKSKVEAQLSPERDRVAYYDVCPQSENCMAAVVILDLDGHRLKSFTPTGGQGPCASILSIGWAGGRTIAAECHLNPSLGEYIETDIATGKVERDLLGLYLLRAIARPEICGARRMDHALRAAICTELLPADR